MIRSKTGKRKRLLIIGIVSLFILLLASAIHILNLPKPPLGEVTLARQCIADAKKAKAHIYSLKAFNDAEKSYHFTISQWKTENEKFIFNRDYTAVKASAIKTCKLGEIAAKSARASSINLTAEMKSRLSELQKEINDFQFIFNKLPVSKELMEHNSKGRLYLKEAELAYENGQYLMCAEKLDKCDRHLLPAFREARKLLTDYFSSFTLWQEWARETVKRSKNRKSTALIVDKFARSCTLYQNGRLVRSFEIELGKNWIGDKISQGDKATPEGFYKVSSKKDRFNTKYYKALLLNYPNEDDQQRFTAMKKNKEIHRDSKIGGAIEIHGSGGKGVDWTDGCIALKNDDMDVLFLKCPAGTEVTIVGSLRSLSEIMRPIPKQG